MHVLIVDDSPLNLKLLRAALVSEGLTVSQASDGVAALAVLEEAPIDAVISDLLMPRMDGFHLCAELRASERFAGLPVIIYTATYLSADDEWLARDMGADMFLRKPASAAVLADALREVIRSRPRRPAVRVREKPALEQMSEYNERLVAKLEETYIALQQRSEELRLAHDQMRRLLAHSPAVIYTLRIDGDRVEPTFVSDNIERLSGLSVAESTRYRWWENSLHPDDRDRVLAGLAEGLAAGGYSMEYRVRHKDGTYRWVEDQNRVLRNETGQPVEAFGVWTDISERKRGEEASARMADLVRSSNDAIVTGTLDGTVTSWNPAAEQMFGYAAAEMIGQPILVLVPPDRADEEEKLLDRIGRGEGIVHYETRRVRKGGRQIDVSLTLSPVRDTAGRITGVSKIVRDITARKRAEQLRSSISLSLSHELNTPLNGIMGVVDLLQADADTMGPAELKELVGMIQTSARRLDRQVSRNLEYAQLEMLGAASAYQPTAERAEGTTAPSALVRSVAEKVAVEHQRRAELALDVADATVLLAPSWLRRLMTELVDNAFKFSAPGLPVRVTGVLHPGRFELSVQDAGRAMTPEQVASVGAFVQFERGRHAQEGTGLGLYLARRIAELHGGTLSLDSTPGRGTTVTVVLPVTP
jgi:PAS domain S-box-containing protein